MNKISLKPFVSRGRPPIRRPSLYAEPKFVEPLHCAENDEANVNVLNDTRANLTMNIGIDLRPPGRLFEPERRHVPKYPRRKRTFVLPAQIQSVYEKVGIVTRAKRKVFTEFLVKDCFVYLCKYIDELTDEHKALLEIPPKLLRKKQTNEVNKSITGHHPQNTLNEPHDTLSEPPRIIRRRSTIAVSEFVFGNNCEKLDRVNEEKLSVEDPVQQLADKLDSIDNAPFTIRDTPAAMSTPIRIEFEKILASGFGQINEADSIDHCSEQSHIIEHGFQLIENEFNKSSGSGVPLNDENHNKNGSGRSNLRRVSFAEKVSVHLYDDLNAILTYNENLVPYDSPPLESVSLHGKNAVSTEEFVRIHRAYLMSLVGSQLNEY